MSLILCITKILHGTGDISVLDYGFFVIHALVDVNKNGVYGLDLINKRW